MLTATTLHAATAFDAAADALKGEVIETDGAPNPLVWFAPADAYDGTATFEISPDGGTTWCPIDGYAVSAIETPINAVASPVANVLYVVPVPVGCQFRVRMSGGSVGSLTVKLVRAYYPR